MGVDIIHHARNYSGVVQRLAHGSFRAPAAWYGQVFSVRGKTVTPDNGAYRRFAPERVFQVLKHKAGPSAAGNKAVPPAVERAGSVFGCVFPQ